MNARWNIAAVVFLVLPLLQSCATTGDFKALSEQVQLLQKSSTDLQRRTEEHSLRLEGIDNSLQMIESRVDDNTTRVEDLKAALAAESVGSIRVSTATLPEPGAPAPKIGAAESAPPLASEAGARPAAAPESPSGKSREPLKTPPTYTPRLFAKSEDLYNSAYGHYEKAEYGQAILEFEEYVANYGKSELADNAQYWIGECYYAQKDYKQAIREFDKVEKNFPKGNKVPSANLKKGLAYRELGNQDEATRELRDVVNRFPDSEEALLANEKLKLWK